MVQKFFHLAKVAYTSSNLACCFFYALAVTRKGISFQMKWIMWLPPEILP